MTRRQFLHMPLFPNSSVTKNAVHHSDGNIDYLVHNWILDNLGLAVKLVYSARNPVSNVRSCMRLNRRLLVDLAFILDFPFVNSEQPNLNVVNGTQVNYS